jgi:hypothetical protein
MGDSLDLFPRGVVKIHMKRLLGVNALGAKLDGAAAELYATISVAGRLIGRTRVFSSLDGDVDLEDLFRETVLPVGEGAIAIEVEYWKEGGKAETFDATKDLPRPAFPLSLHTASFSLAFPWESGTLGKMPGVEVETETRLVPRSERRVVAARTIESKTTHSTLALRDVLIATIVDVEGLYRPKVSFALGARNGERSEGYTSDDHLGRVYLKHDRTGKRIRDGQSILVTARVNVVSDFGVSGDVKLRWRVVELDDPSDDRGDFFNEAFRGYLDPNDHNRLQTGPYGTPLGPHADDNEGKPTKDPPWEAVAGYSLDSSGKTDALTTMKELSAGLYESKVILHCPSRAGDNFILEAEPELDGCDCFMARTGVISIWQRIDVQPMHASDVQMPSLEELVRAYEDAFFQVDCSEAKRLEHTGVVQYDHERLLRTFFGLHNDHFGEPGWFALLFVSELKHKDDTEPSSEVLFEGSLELHRGTGGKPGRPGAPALVQYLDVPKALTVGPKRFLKVEIAHPRWNVRCGVSLAEDVSSSSAAPMTRLWLRAGYETPIFTAGDGSLAHAYATPVFMQPSFHHFQGAQLGSGFGLPENQPLKVTVTHIGEGGVDGLAGARTLGGREYFANFVFIAGDNVRTATHELGHALGFPHRCGYLGSRPTRCEMVYQGDWFFTEPTFATLSPPFTESSSQDKANFCPRHLKEMRRVVLEDNKGYRWQPAPEG